MINSLSRNGHRRLWWLLGALAAGASVAWFWPRADELGRWKAAMKARGEAMNMTDLAPSFSAECAAHEGRFVDAANRLRGSAAMGSTIALMQKTAPGQGSAAWLWDAPTAQWTWEAATEQIDADAPAFASVRDLIARWPEGSARDFSVGVNLGNAPLIPKRKAVQALAGAVVVELHRGSLDAALTNVQAMLRLARLHERECLLVDQMVRVAIADYAVQAAWEALAAPGWDDARLAGLQVELERTGMLSNLPRTLAMERAFIMSGYAASRTNTGGPQNLVSGLGVTGNNVFAEGFNEYVYAPVWRYAWSKQDELSYLKAVEPVLEAAQEAQTNCSLLAIRDRMSAGRAQRDRQRGPLDRFRYQLADAAQPNWEKACQALMRAETRRQLAIAAIALRRHRLKHERWPESLAALVPTFLATVPRDYINGKPLTYVREATDGFSLRSVGPDGRDEEGQGDDLVWLRPDLQPR